MLRPTKRGQERAGRDRCRECRGKQSNREKIACDERSCDLAVTGLRTSKHHDQLGSAPLDDGQAEGALLVNGIED